MNFFLPFAENTTQAESTYKDLLNYHGIENCSLRRIYSLRYEHNGKSFYDKVGEKENDWNAGTILAIIPAGIGYYVWTDIIYSDRCQEKRCNIKLVGKQEVKSVEYFDYNVSIKLKCLEILNMRCFKNTRIEFDSEKKTTILLADNGCGKTTILDAIAYTISPFISYFPNISGENLSDRDIRINKKDTKDEYVKLTASYEFNEEEISVDRIRRRDANVKVDTTGIKNLQNKAAELLSILNEKENTDLPFIAYYGTERGVISLPERKRNFQRLFNPWDCYRSSLNSDTDFKRFFEWFDTKEDEERRLQSEKRNFNIKLPELEAVRKAISQMLEDFSHPRIEIRPLRFLIDKKEGGNTISLRIEQLSDGYRMVLAMVADITSRMAEGNPHLENPLLISGIVLIDEIDQHLHPCWQRNILKNLTDVFPNLQFIVTTHSPLIPLGAADFSQIILLDNEGKAEDLTSHIPLATYDVGQILVSSLFGLPTDRAPKWDHLIQERDDLLSKQKITEKEEERLKELNQNLTELSYGNSEEDIKAMKIIQEAAKRLIHREYD